MAVADLVTEDEAQEYLGRWSCECCAVRCEEGQAVRLACAVARQAREDGSRVLVTVPNGNGRAAVLRELGETDGSIEVIAVSELCERVLAEEARRVGATAPTVLDAIQERLLFEDMKVLGGKPRRIEEMLKFLCRGVSELSFEEEGWLISDEERTVIATLGEHLREREGLLPSFAGAAACAALEDADLACELAVDEVVAVGFSAYDEATQILLGRLAQRLVVFGRDDDAGVPEISYPYPAGLKLWASHMRSLTVAPSVRRLVRHVACTDDGQELATVARLLGREDYDGAALTVVAPTRRWARRIQTGLEAAGLDAALFAGSALAKADPRKKDDAAAALYAALAVAADPASPLALRTWIGLGDWLGASSAWETIRQAARAQGWSVAETLAALGDGRLPEGEGADAEPLLVQAAARVAASRELAAALAPLRGDELVAALESACGVEGASAALGGVKVLPDDDARALFARLREAMMRPVCGDSGRVVVVAIEDAPYLLGEGVVVCAVVDGLITPAQATDPTAPLDIREKLLAEAAVRLAAAKRLGDRFAVVTCFRTMDLEDAAAWGVDIKRLYLDRGRSRARCAPSVLIEDEINRLEK